MKDLSCRSTVHSCQKVFTVLTVWHILYFDDSSSSRLELNEQASRMTASRVTASKMTATLICVKTYWLADSDISSQNIRLLNARSYCSCCWDCVLCCLREWSINICSSLICCLFYAFKNWSWFASYDIIW
jgi:hypothetical protein